MARLRVTGVQCFSVHDGPGIRTTVFLKGCSLRCPWCCNPENIKPEREVYFRASRCTGCLECLKGCEFLERPEDIFRYPEHLECAENCPSGAMGVYGDDLSSEELADLIMRDLDYYEATGGGVTFSGGEPLLQADGILALLEKLGGVHAAVETSLHAPPENLGVLLDRVDLFIVDVKILTGDAAIIGGDRGLFQRNFRMLSGCDVILRFPAVKPYTFNRENIDKLIDFMRDNSIDEIEVLGVHRLAKEKYRSLNLEMGEFEAPDDAEIGDLRSLLENESIKMVYMKI
ncbi:glycyl-radical enzyme activating protein [Methanothermobacter sp. K4]|uniref:glycyl-radical enzyme activating protein n=1 Tax=Methanothermobacter sp. K4 TaxID=2913262 RepID=UPI001EDB21BA|nr:glycyl-radical enzyme activating protein [Methanothermobacter sp. K4]MCG2829240.1 glycyl-radical enzyme activating protein [Methanothermobacter sp. K4]